jgi:hypothetical protein
MYSISVIFKTLPEYAQSGHPVRKSNFAVLFFSYYTAKQLSSCAKPQQMRALVCLEIFRLLLPKHWSKNNDHN